MQVKRTNIIAVIALLAFNLTLPINLYNIGAIFIFMQSDFGLTKAEGAVALGILGSSFFIGRAIFELPSCYFASLSGPKKVVIIGGLINSVPILLSAFSNNLTLIVAARFLSGVGLGASFPQIITLVVRNLRKEQTGLGVGLVMLTSSAGGVLGLLGWAELGALVGWRTSLIASGGLGVITVCALIWAVGPDPAEVKRRITGKQLIKVIFDRKLTVLAIALIGIGGGSVLTWNYIEYYLSSALGVAPALAGLVAGIGPAFALISPLAGRGYDRNPKMRLWVGLSIVILAAGLAIASIEHLGYSILSVALVGIGQGIGFTTVFAAARETVGSAEYEPIAFGWVDTVSLIGPSLGPVIFSSIVVQSNYSYAWLFGSAFTIVFALPLLFFGINRANARKIETATTTTS